MVNVVDSEKISTKTKDISILEIPIEINGKKINNHQSFSNDSINTEEFSKFSWLVDSTNGK